MRDFVITVNSTVDLPREWLEERNVPVVPFKYTIDGETYTDMYGLSAKEFFDKLREGHMSVTSQVNPGEAADMLEPFLKEGKDVLHLGFSSGLSGTLNSMKIAGEELSEKYPEAKIIVIDTLCACLGEGLLLYKALQQKGAPEHPQQHLAVGQPGYRLRCRQGQLRHHLFPGGAPQHSQLLSQLYRGLYLLLHDNLLSETGSGGLLRRRWRKRRYRDIRGVIPFYFHGGAARSLFLIAATSPSPAPFPSSSAQGIRYASWQDRPRSLL